MCRRRNVGAVQNEGALINVYSYTHARTRIYKRKFLSLSFASLSLYPLANINVKNTYLLYTTAGRATYVHTYTGMCVMYYVYVCETQFSGTRNVLERNIIRARLHIYVYTHTHTGESASAAATRLWRVYTHTHSSYIIITPEKYIVMRRARVPRF